MKKKIPLRTRAINYLSRRELSRVELSRKLAPYAENEKIINDLLDELEQRQWQSDERFAEQFISAKSCKYGSQWLNEMLKQHGIDREIISHFQPTHEDEIKQALSILKKKYHHYPQSIEDKRKQMRFIAYRGFNLDTIQAAYQIWKVEKNIEE